MFCDKALLHEVHAGSNCYSFLIGVRYVVNHFQYFRVVKVFRLGFT